MAVDTEKKVTELAQEMIKNRQRISYMTSEIKQNRSEIKKFLKREDEIVKELDVRFSDDDDEIPF